MILTRGRPYGLVHLFLLHLLATLISLQKLDQLQLFLADKISSMGGSLAFNLFTAISQSHSLQDAQFLRPSHHQHHLEVLFGLSSDEGRTMQVLLVYGNGLVDSRGAASYRFLAEYCAQVFEGHRVSGICGHGHAGPRTLPLHLRAAAQRHHAPPFHSPPDFPSAYPSYRRHLVPRLDIHDPYPLRRPTLHPDIAGRYPDHHPFFGGD